LVDLDAKIVTFDEITILFVYQILGIFLHTNSIAPLNFGVPKLSNNQRSLNSLVIFSVACYWQPIRGFHLHFDQFQFLISNTSKLVQLCGEVSLLLGGQTVYYEQIQLFTESGYVL
jgi:hypothetical protein